MQASEVPFFPHDHQSSSLFFILDMSVSCSWWDKCRIHMDPCHCRHACGVVFVVLYLHLCGLLLWPSSSSTTTLIAIERGHRRRQTSSLVPVFEITLGRWVIEIVSVTTSTHITEKHKRTEHDRRHKCRSEICRVGGREESLTVTCWCVVRLLLCECCRWFSCFLGYKILQWYAHGSWPQWKCPVWASVPEDKSFQIQ